MMTDWTRHLLTGAIGVTIPALLHWAGGVDWSVLGPYAIFAQGGVQIATALWNQYSPKA